MSEFGGQEDQLAVHLEKVEMISYLTPVFLFVKINCLFSEKRREGEREGEKPQCVVASHVPPHWGPSLQPRCVP